MASGFSGSFRDCSHQAAVSSAIDQSQSFASDCLAQSHCRFFVLRLIPEGGS